MLPLMGILAAAGAIGKIAGGAAKGRADGRKAEADVNLQRDQLTSDNYRTQQGSLLDAAQGMANQNRTDAEMGLTAPSMRAKQAMLGDALKNFQYKAPTHGSANVVDFGSPYTLSDSTRELGGLLSTGALADQKKGNSPLEKIDYMKMILQAPGQTPLPKAGWLDKVLNGASAIGGLAGAFGEAKTAFSNATAPPPSMAEQYALGKAPNVRFGRG
jgi:hypothetical protein